MPRKKRDKSATGFYHTVSKGNGGQVIFEGSSDRRFYLRLLTEIAREHEVSIHAYCLMSNHIHLLVEDLDNDLSKFMKSINESYASYIARSTGRAGHAFKARFWSEPINSDQYFLATVRYIHSNPEAAGICSASEYPWSSYKAYLAAFQSNDVVEDTNLLPALEKGLVLSMFEDLDSFVRFSKSGNSQARPFPRSKLNGDLGPDELVNVAINLLGREPLYRLGTMMPDERNPYIVLLSNAGFTQSEIARVSGLGKSTISKTLNKGNKGD